jgi:uncharacterized protein
MKIFFRTVLLHTIALSPVAALAQLSTYCDSIAHHQRETNQEFRDEESPLSKRQKKVFESLAYFDCNEAYRVVAKLVPLADQTPIQVPTTLGQLMLYYPRYKLEFSLAGQAYNLYAYQWDRLMTNPDYQHYHWIPFTDLTNGELTYKGGRYLDADILPGDSTVVLDFNKAYNPYCAYSPERTCPKVPATSALATRLEAGELLPPPETSIEAY